MRTPSRPVSPFISRRSRHFSGSPACIWRTCTSRRRGGAWASAAGFSRTSDFVDDTRAFCSIPARHDMSRRVDAGVLARLVAEHRLDEDEAVDTAIDLVTGRPTEAFKL